MTDWEHGPLPKIEGGKFEIWTRHGVRLAHRDAAGFGNIRFDDCTQPEQNIYCGENGVLAWRLIAVEPVPEWERIPLQTNGCNCFNSGNGMCSKSLSETIFGSDC